MKSIPRLLLLLLFGAAAMVNQNAFATPVEVNPGNVVGQVKSITGGVTNTNVAGVKPDGVLGGDKTTGGKAQDKPIVGGVNVSGVQTDGVLGGKPQDNRPLVDGVSVPVKTSEVLSDGGDGAKNGEVVNGVNVSKLQTDKVLGGSKNKSKKNLPCAEVAGVNVDTDKTIGGVANTKGILGDTSVVGTKECSDAERAAQKLGKVEDAAE